MNSDNKAGSSVNQPGTRPENDIEISMPINKKTAVGCILAPSLLLVGLGYSIQLVKNSNVPTDPTPIVSQAPIESTVASPVSSIDEIVADWDSVVRGSSYGSLIANESRSFHDSYAKYVLPMIALRDGDVSAINVNKANALLRDFTYSADAGDISMYTALFNNGVPSTLASRMDKKLLGRLGLLVLSELNEVEALEVNALWKEAANPNGFRRVKTVEQRDADDYPHSVGVFVDGPFSESERASILSGKLKERKLVYDACREESFRRTYR